MPELIAKGRAPERRRQKREIVKQRLVAEQAAKAVPSLPLFWNVLPNPDYERIRQLDSLRLDLYKGFTTAANPLKTQA